MLENFKIEKRNTKIFIIKTENKVIKIPYTFNSWKEIKKERFLIEDARKDPVFSAHLLEYQYFLGWPVTSRFSHIDKDSNALVEEYFKEAFKNSVQWEKNPLGGLLDADFFLNFISSYLPDNLPYFLNFLNSVDLPRSSSHGDFHRRNILVKGGKLYFIDWSRYNKNSSRYFDLLDFYVYSKGRKHETWVKVWDREYNQIPDIIMGIKLPKEYFLAYGIWRVAEELRKFASENALDKYKRKKYIGFLKVLAEKINV